MPAYIKKTAVEILRDQLQKLKTQTPITATGAGSVARAFSEAIATELGDIYDAMDYNLNQIVLSTATGSALDQLGALYNVQRLTVNELTEIDKQLGAFQFYLSTPISTDVVIPAGTNIYTRTDTFIGRQYSYSTTADATIPAGRRRVYVSIKPNFYDSVYTAGVGTLIEHDAPPVAGTTLLCKNDKVIAPQPGLETDDNYRTRIQKAIRVASSGTMEAVRFAGLGVQGVRDIKIRSTPYGMGSFEAIVIPDSTPNAAAITAAATEAMNAVRPVGVRMYVKNPIRVPVSMEIQLLAPTAGGDRMKTTLPSRAEVAITRYINSLLPGEQLVYNKLIQQILDSSEFIRDLMVKSFKVDGKEIIRKNYQPAIDEQLYVKTGDIIITVASS